MNKGIQLIKNKEECISLLNKTIEQLESFGYQWALERAEDLKRVKKFVEDTTPESIDATKYINSETGEVDIIGYTSEYLESERKRAKRRYEKAYKAAVERSRE